MNHWSANFIGVFLGLGLALLVTVPMSIAIGDAIWPFALVTGLCSIGFGIYLWWSRSRAV